LKEIDLDPGIPGFNGMMKTVRNAVLGEELE
jgi:hypothetical protein